MVLSPIFSSEQQAIAPHVGFRKALLASFGIMGAACFLAPGFLPMPRVLKTAFLAASSINFIGAAALTYKSSQEEKIHKAIQEAQLDQLRGAMATQRVKSDFVQRVGAEMDLFNQICQMPEAIAVPYLQELGLDRFLPRAQAITVEAEPVGAIGDGVHNLHEIDLDEWRQRQQEEAGNSAPQLYAHCIKKPMVWAGNSGEGKTSCAHYALYQWAKADPDLIVYVFDSHFGMGRNPKFRSNWLGVPKLKEVPKNIQSCVVKVEPIKLGAFLKPVADLFEARKDQLDALDESDEEIDSDAIAHPHVVVVIDEFTNLLRGMSKEQAEAVIDDFSKFATEAQKFGIFLWFILHSLTKEDLCNFPRHILRQGHLVMGAEMTQDKVQVGIAPRKLPQSAIDNAQAIYQEVGLPAGFVTSLPVPNGYLPVAPVSDLRDLILDWVKPGEQAIAPTPDQPETTPEPSGEVQQFKQWLKAQGAIAFPQVKAAWYSMVGRDIPDLALWDLAYRDKLESPIEKKFVEAMGSQYPDLLLGCIPQFPAGNYRLDFAFPDQQLAVELDGHNYHSSKEQRTHDAARDRWLASQGWQVLRVTGSEITKSPIKVVNEIAAILRGKS